jgi:hypothetical protein
MYIRGILGLGHKRALSTLVKRGFATDHVQNDSRIASGRRNRRVTGNCGDTKQVGMVGSHHHGHGVVVARIAVKNHFYS